MKLPRQIVMRFYNSFFNTEIMRVKMPYDMRLSMNGFYSSKWRKLKIELANQEQIDKNFIRLKYWFESEVSDRMVITLKSGIVFNSPFEMNKTDYKIIDLHLEALKLSLTNTGADGG